MSKTSKIVFRCDFWNVDGWWYERGKHLSSFYHVWNLTKHFLSSFVYLYVMADDKLNVPFL